MNIESLRDYCLSKPSATEELPFGPDILVFKIMGKIFALTSLNTENLSVNLKCDPEKAVQLREEYDCVRPGYHMNKKHWNTVTFDNSVKDSLIREWIDHSYETTINSLPKKLKAELGY